MLTMPKRDIDNPTAGAGNLFPAGTFLFTILTPTNERVRVTPIDELPPFMTTDVNSFTTPPSKQVPWFLGDREETSVWLGKAQPADDDSPDVGEKIFFHSIVTADGSVGIHDLETEPNGEGTSIRVKKNLAMFFNLADALGATYDADDGGVAISDDFCEMLQNGDFDDQTIIATIEHRTRGKHSKRAGEMYHVLTGFQAV